MGTNFNLQAGTRSGIKLIHVETGHGKREKQKILESIDKDGYFKDSKLKSELILLKLRRISFLRNLNYSNDN